MPPSISMCPTPRWSLKILSIAGQALVITEIIALMLKRGQLRLTVAWRVSPPLRVALRLSSEHRHLGGDSCCEVFANSNLGSAKSNEVNIWLGRQFWNQTFQDDGAAKIEESRCLLIRAAKLLLTLTMVKLRGKSCE
jgi:hypothetical protein